MKNEDAIAAVIGVILLIGITVILAATIIASVGLFTPHKSAPHAVIVIERANGNLSFLHNNSIILRHKGGDFLTENNTEVIIKGTGCAYTGNITSCQPQDIQVTYRDLSGNNYDGENGEKLGKIVEGSTWDAGEKIILYGYDGRNINSPISDIAQNSGNTVDRKWRLEPGSTVSVTVVDISTDQIIATLRAVVEP